MRKCISRMFLIAVLTHAFIISATAQEKKVAATTQELFKEIAYMDSVIFEAFNTQNMEKFKSLFTEDLEWFQDNGGLIPYKIIFENFANTFKKEFKLTRQLVRGSLEVHPLKEYGAIEIGAHQFRHIENGKEEIGTFKFVMIWQKKDGQWKISRVISYDH
jgi:ketosteroid isomerase-like protein